MFKKSRDFLSGKLCAAVSEGDLLKTVALVEAGADPNYEDGIFLIAAGVMDKLDILEYLVSKGFDYKAAKDYMGIKGARIKDDT